MKRRALTATAIAAAILGATAVQAVAVDSSDGFTLTQDCSIPGISVTIAPDRSSERFDIFLGDEKVFSDVPGEVDGDSQTYPIEVVDGTYVVTLTGVDTPDEIAGDGPATIVIDCGTEPTVPETTTTTVVVDATVATSVPVTTPAPDAPAALPVDATPAYTG